MQLPNKQSWHLGPILWESRWRMQFWEQAWERGGTSSKSLVWGARIWKQWGGGGSLVHPRNSYIVPAELLLPLHVLCQPWLLLFNSSSWDLAWECCQGMDCTRLGSDSGTSPNLVLWRGGRGSCPPLVTLLNSWVLPLPSHPTLPAPFGKNVK